MFYPRLKPQRSAGIEARRVAGALTSMRIDELITNLAVGIARGQLELDKVCMEIAVFMGDAQIEFGKKPGTDQPDLLSLIELGFTPNFYQFVDTILELRVAITSAYEETRERDVSTTNLQSAEYKKNSDYENKRNTSRTGIGGLFGGFFGGLSAKRETGTSETSGSSSVKKSNLYLRTVDASYASTYNYSVEGSSLIKTKILPIPPPTVLEELIREKVAERREEIEQAQFLEHLHKLLPEIIHLVDQLEIPVASMDFKKAVANKLKAGIDEISGKYYSIRPEYWVIIANINEREIADNALDLVNENMTTLINLYPAGDEFPSDTSTGDESLKVIKDNLTKTFKDSIIRMNVGLPKLEQSEEEKKEEGDE